MVSDRQCFDVRSDWRAGQQAAGLPAALVVSDQQAMDRADLDMFRATGVTNLISISPDHSGGARAVLAVQPTASSLSSVGAQHALNGVRTVQSCVAGQRWQCDWVEFEILHPTAEDYVDKQKTTALSCSFRVANANRAALLVGDIEQPKVARLVAAGAALRAQSLLLPHHGSKTSSNPEFLNVVQPRFAKVQTGYRNRLGHPVGPVLVRYDERQITVVDTPHCGALR